MTLISKNALNRSKEVEAGQGRKESAVFPGFSPPERGGRD